MATWRSPGTFHVTALHLWGLYQEIPTGLKALGMTWEGNYIAAINYNLFPKNNPQGGFKSHFLRAIMTTNKPKGEKP